MWCWSIFVHAFIAYPRVVHTQVLRGGENLLEKVQVLETAAQQGAEALAAQQAARRAAEARIAQLEAAASEAAGRYSSVQVRGTSGDRARSWLGEWLGGSGGAPWSLGQVAPGSTTSRVVTHCTLHMHSANFIAAPVCRKR